MGWHAHPEQVLPIDNKFISWTSQHFILLNSMWAWSTEERLVEIRTNAVLNSKSLMTVFAVKIDKCYDRVGI
jgi:hypothetical protein